MASLLSLRLLATFAFVIVSCVTFVKSESKLFDLPSRLEWFEMMGNNLLIDSSNKIIGSIRIIRPKSVRSMIRAPTNENY